MFKVTGMQHQQQKTTYGGASLMGLGSLER